MKKSMLIIGLILGMVGSIHCSWKEGTWSGWTKDQPSRWSNWLTNKEHPTDPYEQGSYFPRLAVFDESERGKIIAMRAVLGVMAIPLIPLALKAIRSGARGIQWLYNKYYANQPQKNLGSVN